MDSELFTPPQEEPPSGGSADRHAVPLYGTRFWTDPQSVYAEARKRWGPVAPVLLEPGVPAWLVLGYAEILQVTRSPELFCRDPRRWGDWQKGRIPPDSDLLPLMRYRPAVLFTDGADHERHRAAVKDSLSKLDKSSLVLEIQRFADLLIDGFADTGEADLVGQYARLLPLSVINKVCDLPEEDGRMLLGLLSRVWDGDDATEAGQQVTRYLSGLVERRRRTPGHDLVSWLIGHPSGLSDEEVVHNLSLIIVGGTDPTANLLANTLRVLVTDPGFRSSVAGSRLMLESAIDQVLWRDPPIQSQPAYYALGDLRLGNAQIRVGDPVAIGYAAAHADPALAASPGSAATTGNRAHLGWGVGAHRCPAQDLARLIVEFGIRALLDRLGGFHLAVPEDQLRWRPSPFARGLVSLPVRFTPQAVSRPASASDGVPVPAEAPPAPSPLKQPAGTARRGRLGWRFTGGSRRDR